MRKESWVVFISFFASAVSAANYGQGFKQTMVPVEGCTISATVGGNGPTVLLLHGYAETAQMWKPLAVALAPRFTVVAIDLPGIGDSSIPAGGIDMTTLAKRIHEAVQKLGYGRARVVGHDIGHQQGLGALDHGGKARGDHGGRDPGARTVSLRAEVMEDHSGHLGKPPPVAELEESAPCYARARGGRVWNARR